MYSEVKADESERLNKLRNLLSFLGLVPSGHVCSLQDGADDGQPLPRFELRGEGQ